MAAKLPSRRSLTPEQGDYHNWPQVDVSLLRPNVRREYERRRDAVTAYLDGCSEKEIRALSRTEKQKGYRRDHVLYFLSRCLALHKDGRIYGFRGLLPYKRQKAYTRTKPLPALATQIVKGHRAGYAGAFAKYLNDHPNVQKALLRRLLNKPAPGMMPEQNPDITTTVFSAFLEAAKKDNGGILEYPHNVDEQARRSLASFAKRLFITDTTERIRATEGPQAAIKWENAGGQKVRHSTRPYERVEIDFKKLDAIWTIEIPHPMGGDPILLELERIWLIVVLETNSRATLGYRLSLNTEPNAGDVMAAIDHALAVWTPRNLKVPLLDYQVGTGLPSGVIPQCAHALWDQTFMDNAWSNLAYAVTDGLMDVVGSSVNVGIAGAPNRRPFIERFFGTLEKYGFRILANTTGSHPKDKKKMDPSKMAKRYRLTIEALYDIVDVVLASLNDREGHKGIGGRSPLQVLQYHANDPSALQRGLTLVDEKELLWLAERVNVTVQGNPKTGKSPLVDFAGAEYTNNILKDSLKLIGQKITLLVKPHQDIRSLLAFRSDGTEIGYLKVRGGWADSPHNLQQRKLTNRLIRHGQIASAAKGNPIENAKVYFTKQAHTSRRAATHLANFEYSVTSGDILFEMKPNMPETPSVELPSENRPKLSNKPVFVE